MPNYLTNDTELTSIANAIRAKSGGSSPLTYPTEFVSAINNIPSGGGGGSASEKQINFMDYDGTILHSYTKAEINAMTSESDLPANPSHTGLTSQGWNWTLAQIKAQLTSAPDGVVWVGQMYVTDDGKNRIYIHIVDKALCSMRLNFAVNGTVVVDWGDNTATETVTGTSLTTRKQTGVHTYSDIGDYVVTISVTSGSMAFYSTTSYGLISHQTSSTQGENRAFSNMVSKIEIGNNTNIGAYSFSYCYSLGSITIPNAVTSIGNNAFSNCYSLGSITIPNAVTSIGSSAFSYCYSLGSTTIPNTVTSIGSNAFSYCNSLGSITIPNAVTSIGSIAFSGCSSIGSITIPNTVTSIGSSAFSSCSSLDSITIPNAVTSIGSSAFSNCYSLDSITIPNTVTSIGSSAFDGCYSLGSITIPNAVTSIGNSAFSNCSSLGSITIPNTVTSIGSSAFSACQGLQEIHFKGATPPTVGASNTFTSLPTYCKIYVPTGSLSAYKTATNYPNPSTYTYVEE